MKKKCTFSISDIDAGWLDMDFKIEEKIVASISASYIINGKKSPKYLLQILTDFITEKIDTSYVLFYREPGTDILSLEKDKLIIAYSKKYATEIDLCGNMTFDEISNIIDIEKIDLQEEIDIKIFIHSVYKAFYKYANNRLLYDKYEENWDYFPDKEWKAFEQCVKQKGWNKKDW